MNVPYIHATSQSRRAAPPPHNTPHHTVLFMDIYCSLSAVPYRVPEVASILHIVHRSNRLLLLTLTHCDLFAPDTPRSCKAVLPRVGSSGCSSILRTESLSVAAFFRSPTAPPYKYFTPVTPRSPPQVHRHSVTHYEAGDATTRDLLILSLRDEPGVQCDAPPCARVPLCETDRKAHTGL